MGWIATLKDWRRERLLRRLTLDEAAWRHTLARYPALAALGPGDASRLQSLVKLFLHEKSIHGAAGLEVNDAMRVAIAAQACLLVLELGLDAYRGWVEVIVYPGGFVARFQYTDEDGVVHDVAEPMTGEAWEHGPVILSWEDAGGRRAEAAYNVVMHEFAHKLDMLNGAANGFPPLHSGMSRRAWSDAFGAAYDDFCARLDAREELPIDDYAAESPSEFFAVMSEVFFGEPATLKRLYPAVYVQLAAYYRQDPYARMTAALEAAR